MMTYKTTYPLFKPSFYLLGCFLILISKLSCYADNDLSHHLQLLVVTSHNWEEQQGSLQCFERANQDEKWTPVGTLIPVVIGKSGMAWGIGLYQLNSNSSCYKIEGDLKAPAGIFSLGCAFGFLPKSQMADLKIDYLELNEFIEAVDDPLSNFYNQIVDNREVVIDWNSSEKMREEPLYELGLVINHNLPNPKAAKGSAIFFHQWRNKNTGTAGCTAMNFNSLKKVIYWLEKNKNPALIQLPNSLYSELQSNWNLPDLATEIH